MRLQYFDSRTDTQTDRQTDRQTVNMFVRTRFVYRGVSRIVYTVERLVRLIESNVKCRHLKNLPREGLCGRCFICLRPPPPSYDPLHTVYVYTVYLFTQGRGGRASQREGQ
jgi:hypothetical protein